MRGKNLNCGIRGGLWDEAHLERMGPAVWLFGWLVHRQTREHNGVGLVLGGSALTYKIISEDTGMAVRTLKRWMARLGRSGYVRVKHTTYKRMIIQITKAKKFGPQQLGFPQNSFFAQKSKGPLPALESGSKGPMVAHPRKEYREYKSERQINNRTHGDNFPAALEQTARQNTSGTFSQASATARENAHVQENPKCESVGRQSFARSGYENRAAPRPYAPSDAFRFRQSERALREAAVRAELRVGAGPDGGLSGASPPRRARRET
ncbi:MAG: hypothetical protein ACRD4H_08085 [Candidatus Acidiferrales bacterium]